MTHKDVDLETLYQRAEANLQDLEAIMTVLKDAPNSALDLNRCLMAIRRRLLDLARM